MSMMTLLRRAFGFSPDSEEEEEDYDPTVPTYAAGDSRQAQPSRETAVAASADNASMHAVAAATAVETADNAALPAALFDAVIEVFNSAQPDFIKKCLDTEAQRKFLIESIDSRLREQAEQAMRTSANQWKDEKSRLEARISELEGDDNAMTVLRKENSRLQLSVDRQKRALLDRINDLESQLAKQAEEKERFYSRRKPSVLEEELTQAKSRIEELEATVAEKEEQKKAAGGDDIQTEAEVMESPDAREELLAEHERRIAEHESLIAERDQKIAELTAECGKLREEAARQSTLREQLEVKTSMSDNMINDLRNQAAAARRELETMQQEQLQAVEHIQKELDGFEELKARKDAKIAELQESNASLRRTIETNLYNQANSEMRLRKQIKELQSKLDSTATAVESAPEYARPADQGLEIGFDDAPKAPEKQSQQRRRGRPRKVKIDSSLDNTEWFSEGKHDDPDFGYHEPPRKPANDNEAQLSLF